MTLEVGKILSLSLLHNFNVLQHFFSVFFLTKRLLSHIQSVWGLVAENNREQLCSFWCLENNSNFWHLDMGVITWYFYYELETQMCWTKRRDYAVIRIIWLLLNGETFFHDESQKIENSSRYRRLTCICKNIISFYRLFTNAHTLSVISIFPLVLVPWVAKSQNWAFIIKLGIKRQTGHLVTR